jgi:hypothetical protein|tara:strand:+ start:33 stop:395 length:363 start_codon:yes stop_codon:yes gene_type:complete
MNKSTIWAVTAVKEQSSMHHNDNIYKIELESTTGDSAITYVDPHNDNYKNWEHICNRPNKGFFITDLFEASYKTKQGETLMDADSDVEIFFSGDKQKVLDALAELNRPPKEKIFADLFGI